MILLNFCFLKKIDRKSYSELRFLIKKIAYLKNFDYRTGSQLKIAKHQINIIMILKHIKTIFWVFFFLMNTDLVMADVPDEVSSNISIKKVTQDRAIEKRLEKILQVTQWFESIQVKSDEGIVFLEGKASNKKEFEWAGELAKNTEGVIAVVNNIEIYESEIVDLSPALKALKLLWEDIIRYSPMFAIGLLILILTLFLSKLSVNLFRMLFKKRVKSPLLLNVMSRLSVLPIIILGFYILLKISGLTHLALTLIGGTSIIGLVIGFAFKDIVENFLASILISLQHPFAGGDLIEVAGHQGYVQSVNTRSTLLMTLDGNHVQIPNSIIYKEAITNFTANPKGRIHFSVGIGYDDSISKAQNVALELISNHPAVVKDPEPLVLVEELGASTVNLRVYFWIDVERFSIFKVRSAIIRLLKHAFQRENIEMPDEAREIVFPKGVPVQMTDGKTSSSVVSDDKKDNFKNLKEADEEKDVNLAEGDLSSEEDEIQKQAKNSRAPEGETNLLIDDKSNI